MLVVIYKKTLSVCIYGIIFLFLKSSKLWSK